MEYKKDFDGWNKIKKELENKILDDSFFFLDREVWWASMGVNIGNEMDGKNENFERPVLILKKFDENNFLGLLMSTQHNTEIEQYEYAYKNQKVFISLRQLRYLNIKRLLRLVTRINEGEFKMIKERYRNLFL